MATDDQTIELQRALVEALNEIAASDPDYVASVLSNFGDIEDDLVAVKLTQVSVKLLPTHETIVRELVSKMLQSRTDMVIYAALDVLIKIAGFNPGVIWPVAIQMLEEKTSRDSLLHVNDHPWGRLFELGEVIVAADPPTYLPLAVDAIVEFNKPMMRPEVAADEQQAKEFDWPTIMIMGWNHNPSIQESDLVGALLIRPFLTFAENWPVEARRLASNLLARPEPFAQRAALWPLGKLAAAGDRRARRIFEPYLTIRYTHNWSLWQTAHAQMAALAGSYPQWVIRALTKIQRQGEPLSEFDVAPLASLATRSPAAASLIASASSQSGEMCKTVLSHLRVFAASQPRVAGRVLTTALEVLEPDNGDIIYLARDVIRQLASDDFVLVSDLLESLVKKDELEYKSLLADHLVEIALDLPGTLDRVKEWLNLLATDRDPHVRESVATSMRQLSKVDPEFSFQMLTTLASDPDPAVDSLEPNNMILVRTVRGHVASALPALAQQRPHEILTMLLDLAADPVDIVRWLALHSLYNAFGRWRDAQAPLRDLLNITKPTSPLNDPSPTVRINALYLAFSPAAIDADFADSILPKLASFIGEEAPDLRERAVDAVVELAFRHKTTALMNLFQQILTSDDQAIRRRVAQRVRVLVDGGAPIGDLMAFIERLSLDHDASVREEIALGWSR